MSVLTPQAGRQGASPRRIVLGDSVSLVKGMRELTRDPWGFCSLLLSLTSTQPENRLSAPAPSHPRTISGATGPKPTCPLITRDDESLDGLNSLWALHFGRGWGSGGEGVGGGLGGGHNNCPQNVGLKPQTSVLPQFWGPDV